MQFAGYVRLVFYGIREPTVPGCMGESVSHVHFAVTYGDSDGQRLLRLPFTILLRGTGELL